ncbi:MAG: IS5/IS1182 family transposase, partial [Dysgonamonadaceae bacterium]|nr:IS5/IS1182 family transposase [Dysgonamonadaceae bacterium]
MIGKIAVDDHREPFRTRLEDLLNPNHELAQSSKKIEWQYFEDLFKDFYSGKPSRRAMPIRL